MFIIILKQRIREISKKKVGSAILLNNTMYCSYKSTLEPDLYFSETPGGFWSSSNRKQPPVGEQIEGSYVPRHERLCKYCANINKRHVEDEYHFIMECPLYRKVRAEFISDIGHFINIYYFSEIMSSCKQSIIKKLSVYTYHAVKLHINFTPI